MSTNESACTMLEILWQGVIGERKVHHISSLRYVRTTSTAGSVATYKMHNLQGNWDNGLKGLFTFTAF